MPLNDRKNFLIWRPKIGSYVTVHTKPRDPYPAKVHKDQSGVPFDQVRVMKLHNGQTAEVPWNLCKHYRAPQFDK